MGGVTGETNGCVVENKSEKETVNGQPIQEVIFGELIWVKVNETSWWPAQVVDENLVRSANKPSIKGSSSDVLVRLYGCYIYKYVDIENLNAEFKNIQIDKNFSYDDILKKSIEQDLSTSNSNRSRKRQKPKSKVLTEASTNRSSDKSQSKVSSKKQKPETAPGTTQVKTKNTEPSSPKIASLRPQELSARRMKVMQSLGLVAPSGSPFPRSPPVLN